MTVPLSRACPASSVHVAGVDVPAGLGAAGVHQDRHVPLDVPRGQMLSCRVEVEK